MSRQTQWVGGGVYQPTHQPRHAYGPRRSSAYRTYADDPAWERAEVTAASAARYPSTAGYELVTVRMPRGGVRHLIVCPRCSTRSAKLYERYHHFLGRWEIACRRCWGLRYRSQYDGRCPEAHPEYLSRAEHRERGMTPRSSSYGSPHAINRWRTRQRRLVRYAALRAILDARRRRDLERRELAFDIGLAVLLARDEAERTRRWRRTVNQVLWHHHEPTMRALIAMPETPEWVQSVLAEALKQPQSDTPSQRNAAQLVKDALDRDKTARSATIITREELDDLRAQYAALRLARRATVAA